MDNKVRLGGSQKTAKDSVNKRSKIFSAKFDQFSTKCTYVCLNLANYLYLDNVITLIDALKKY